LVYLIRKRQDLKFNYIFYLFALFILACGFTHLMAVYNVWNGAYWLSGAIKAVTAFASLGTAIAVWPLIPRALALPSTESLQILNERLEYEITQKQSAVEHAERLSKVKSRFIANLSHELRTPLNAVLGFSDLLFSKEKDSEKRRALATIRSAGNALLTLLNDLLDMSKIEAGKLDIKFTEVSLSHLFSEMVELFKQKAQVKGIQFSTRLPENTPAAVMTDGIRLRQILLNLCSNAIKFTDKGSVCLELETTPTHNSRHNGDCVSLAIKIKDSGIGISKQDQETIFGAFNQAGQSRDRGIDGTGLGLTISVELAKNLNGKIELESTPGQGSCFTILLNDVEVVQSSTDGEQQLKPAIINFENSGLSFQPATILIVDDVEYNRNLLRSYLDRWNFTLLEAANGKVAIELAKRYQPEVILMDLKMPVMDGYEASKLLRQDKQTQHAKILVVTASVMPEDKVKILNIADRYLKKPINQADLIAAVMDYIPYTEEQQIGLVESRIAESQQGVLDRDLMSTSYISEFLTAIDMQDIATMEKLCQEISMQSGPLGKYLFSLLEQADYGSLAHYLKNN
jgi:two-component system, NarL family, sensor histidine kinase EvgS